MGSPWSMPTIGWSRKSDSKANYTMRLRNYLDE